MALTGRERQDKMGNHQPRSGLSPQPPVPVPHNATAWTEALSSADLPPVILC